MMGRVVTAVTVITLPDTNIRLTCCSAALHCFYETIMVGSFSPPRNTEIDIVCNTLIMNHDNHDMLSMIRIMKHVFAFVCATRQNDRGTF